MFNENSYQFIEINSAATSFVHLIVHSFYAHKHIHVRILAIVAMVFLGSSHFTADGIREKRKTEFIFSLPSNYTLGSGIEWCWQIEFHSFRNKSIFMSLSDLWSLFLVSIRFDAMLVSIVVTFSTWMRCVGVTLVVTETIENWSIDSIRVWTLGQFSDTIFYLCNIL